MPKRGPVVPYNDAGSDHQNEPDLSHSFVRKSTSLLDRKFPTVLVQSRKSGPIYANSQPLDLISLLLSIWPLSDLALSSKARKEGQNRNRVDKKVECYTDYRSEERR